MEIVCSFELAFGEMNLCARCRLGLTCCEDVLISSLEQETGAAFAFGIETETEEMSRSLFAALFSSDFNSRSFRIEVSSISRFVKFSEVEKPESYVILGTGWDGATMLGGRT